MFQQQQTVWMRLEQKIVLECGVCGNPMSDANRIVVALFGSNDAGCCPACCAIVDEKTVPKDYAKRIAAWRARRRESVSEFVARGGQIKRAPMGAGRQK